jgi:pSer/pThr/pTyr-binding forkhead associated (FHA) protein
MEMAMKIGALEYLKDGRVVDLFPLLQENSLVGRESGDLVIEDEEASAEHCQIQKIGERYHVIDLASTNGTFVNGERVNNVKLSVGDEIRIGSVTFRFTDFTLASEPNPHELASSLSAGLGRPPGEAGELCDDIERIRNKMLPAGQLVLDIIYEDGSRQVLRFDKGRAELGRSLDRGRFREDPELSKFHATIRLGEQGQLFVFDHNSTNGTFVNEERLAAERLIAPGDMVRIGRTRIWCRPEISKNHTAT